VIYGLLPNKTAMSYQLFFDMLKGLRTNLNLDSISCNFEIALFRMISNSFPNAETKGCFFPLCEKLLGGLKKFLKRHSQWMV